MVCQICGRRSSYYPLCMDHNQMYDKGDVIRIGSANPIPTSVHDNPEVGICTTDQSAVSDAMLYFEEKWDGAIDRKWV